MVFDFKYNLATMIFNVIVHLINNQDYRSQMEHITARFGLALLEDLSHILTPYPMPAQAFMSIEQQIVHSGYQVE